MSKCPVVLLGLLFASLAWPQNASKHYPWENKDTPGCNKYMTFCWYGADLVSDPEVTAWGRRWVTQDKDEDALEWVTEVRCVHRLDTCILARNQIISDSDTLTNIDLYQVDEWSGFQIRATEESSYPPGHECEIDTLLINRVDASVSMLSVPGPAAATKGCAAVWYPKKPKTVMYTLELGTPGVPQSQK